MLPIPSKDMREAVLRKANATRLEAMKNIAQKKRLAPVLAKVAARKRAMLRDEPYNPIDITHFDVSYTADETAGTINVGITMTVKALADGMATADFIVEPLPTYSLTDIEGNALAFTPYDYGDNYVLAMVTLPKTLNTGEETQLILNMSGKPNCDPDSYFGMVFCTVSPDFTFFGGATWVPFKAAETLEGLYSTGYLDITVSTPLTHQALSTSAFDSVNQVGERLVYRFKGTIPFDSLGLAYAPFDIYSATSTEGREIKGYMHSGTRDYGQYWADACGQMIDYYSDTFGLPYAFGFHNAVQGTDSVGGGMSLGTATFYVASAFNTDPQEFTSESLFSHELAHSWWGYMIKNSESYTAPWLTEGLTEYSSRLYGYEVWPAYYQNYLYEFYFNSFRLSVDPSMETPMTSPYIYENDATVYYYLTYLKGSHFVRVLQWELGDELFFQGIKKYAQDNHFAVANDYSDTTKFKAAFEAVSGRDLSGLFDRWTLNTGYPIYEFAAEFGEPVDGSYPVHIRVEQIQTDDPFPNSVPAYVWVGSESNPRKLRLEFQGRVADQTFTFNRAPRGMNVDYESWIWGDKTPKLKGDVDSSNEVDGVDFIYIAYARGASFIEQDQNYFSSGDVDRNGVINDADMNLLLENFGRKGEIHD